MFTYEVRGEAAEAFFWTVYDLAKRPVMEGFATTRPQAEAYAARSIQLIKLDLQQRAAGWQATAHWHTLIRDSQDAEEDIDRWPARVLR
jgi:hypothetical protein